jgi:hypothetical protein
MNHADVHSHLTMHRLRTAELYAEADRERLVHDLRGGSRWWSRGARRHRGAGSRSSPAA